MRQPHRSLLQPSPQPHPPKLNIVISPLLFFLCIRWDRRTPLCHYRVEGRTAPTFSRRRFVPCRRSRSWYMICSNSLWCDTLGRKNALSSPPAVAGPSDKSPPHYDRPCPAHKKSGPPLGDPLPHPSMGYWILPAGRSSLPARHVVRVRIDGNGLGSIREGNAEVHQHAQIPEHHIVAAVNIESHRIHYRIVQVEILGADIRPFVVLDSRILRTIGRVGRCPWSCTPSGCCR